jgi:hypothetical protein
VGVDRQEEADYEKLVEWNLAAMTEKDMEVVEKLWMELANKRAQLDAEWTEDEVGQKAALCQEALSSILDARGKKITISARSQRSWNANIKEERRSFGRETKR